MKVHPVSIALAYDGQHERRHIAHVIMVDDDGNVWERFSDWTTGRWDPWPAELIPDRQAKRTRRSGRRARRK